MSDSSVDSSAHGLEPRRNHTSVVTGRQIHAIDREHANRPHCDRTAEFSCRGLFNRSPRSVVCASTAKNADQQGDEHGQIDDGHRPKSKRSNCLHGDPPVRGACIHSKSFETFGAVKVLTPPPIQWVSQNSLQQETRLPGFGTGPAQGRANDANGLALPAAGARQEPGQRLCGAAASGGSDSSTSCLS